MADAETATPNRTARLQVAPARQEESGQGIARMPRSAFQKLGITEGDVVEIKGKRTTVAIAMAAYPEDDALDVVRLDGLQRGNAEQVQALLQGAGALLWTQAPTPRPVERMGSLSGVRRCLSGR